MRQALLLIVLVTSGRAANIDEFKGIWTRVREYFDSPDFSCMPASIHPTGRFCECGAKKIPTVKFKIMASVAQELPVIPVDSDWEVQEAAKSECTCEGVPASFYIFRRINDNYFLFYYNVQNLSNLGVYAKAIPSQEQFDSFASTIDSLKGKVGTNMCMKSAIKEASAKKT